MNSGDVSDSPARHVAVVTGANKGIGFFVARDLARAGSVVIMGSRDEGAGLDAASRLRDEGLNVVAVQLDVTDAASVAAAVTTVTSLYNRVDALINNAAITRGDRTLADVSVDDLQRTYDTNTIGAIRMIQSFLPLLRRSRTPRIVNVASSLGSLGLMTDPSVSSPGPKFAAYRLSKAALNALTILLDSELREEGFAVNAVSPGRRATDLIPGPPSPGAGDPADGTEAIVEAALHSNPRDGARFLRDDGGTYPW